MDADELHGLECIAQSKYHELARRLKRLIRLRFRSHISLSRAHTKHKQGSCMMNFALISFGTFTRYVQSFTRVYLNMNAVHFVRSTPEQAMYGSNMTRQRVRESAVIHSLVGHLWLPLVRIYPHKFIFISH